MSNSYTKAAFGIVISEAEADLLRLAQDASDMLDNIGQDEDRHDAYAQLGPAFAEAFPPNETDPFAAFLALFPDANFPFFDCSITTEADPAAPGRQRAFFSGDQFGIEQVANLIFAVCKSALPCGFEYANDCDRLRVGEFGGGYVAITERGVRYGSSSRLLDRALRREVDEGTDGYVLATRDREHGLSFWNSEDGFGSLQSATVFSEAEAAKMDKPIANDEPEWLAMPCPLS